MAVNITEVEKHISTARLSSYSGLNPSSTVEETIALYYWNKALCGAFYPALQCLEITLRNAIHTAASAHFSNSAWYDRLVKKVADELFARGHLQIDPRTGRRQKSESEKKIQEAKYKLSKVGKANTPPGVVAELSFGFWVKFLTGQYEDINTRSKLWPNLTATVFPNTTGAERNIGFLFQKYDGIRQLRNRLSHHEPLWKSSSSTNFQSAVAHVQAQYGDVLACIGYISMDRKEYLLGSYLGKEFQRLTCVETIYEFVDRDSVKSRSVHSFRKDLNLHFNNCEKGKATYIARGKGNLFRMVKV